LVVAEIALSVALIAVSGLLIHSMLSLQRVGVGFDSSNVFTLSFRCRPSKYLATGGDRPISSAKRSRRCAAWRASNRWRWCGASRSAQLGRYSVHR